MSACALASLRHEHRYVWASWQYKKNFIPFLRLKEFSRSDCWELYFRRICHLQPHIDYVLAVASQRFYLLNQLKKMSLATSRLNNVFSALIVSRILYALPAFYGFILQSDVDRIDVMFRKAKRWGITTYEFNMEFLSNLSDFLLFKNIIFVVFRVWLWPLTSWNNLESNCLYHSKAHVWLPIWLLWTPSLYFVPFSRFSTSKFLGFDLDLWPLKVIWVKKSTIWNAVYYFLFDFCGHHLSIPHRVLKKNLR